MSEPAPPKMTDDQREELLARLWELLGHSHIAALSVPEPSAATLTAARQFLADNGVNVDSLRRMRGSGLSEALRATLPTFRDDAAAQPFGA